LKTKILVAASVLALASVPFALALGAPAAVRALAVAAPVLLGAAFTGHASLKRYAFTVWVLSSATASMVYPSWFGAWFGYDLGGLITPLIQVIMFGMGTTLALSDFGRIFAMPWPVFVGLFLQFTIMPFVGFGLAHVLSFEPEVAAGIILIGSVPGGVASNLMCYLANGNVALSVTMTAVSTLISPIMTPFMMKMLAGRLVPIKFIAMMLSILNMVIVPVVAGLAANRILYSSGRWSNRALPLVLVSTACLALALAAGVSPALGAGPLAGFRGGLVVGLLLVGVTALAKAVVQVALRGPGNWMDTALPKVSMAGICMIIAVITARSSAKLLTVGPALLAVVVLHNGTGYGLAYLCSRLLRLNERDSRAVAFEVGMQNGGMASGLAMGVLASPSTALAPAIFGPWQNVSGSLLATAWLNRDRARSGRTRK
jgi:BASS family bile acid:Na+ symporter